MEEVRHPLEVPLVVAAVELAAERRVAVQIGVLSVPIAEGVRGATARKDDAALRLVPLGCAVVEPVPRELVEHEQRRKARQLVERSPEVVDVVERSPGESSVEPIVVVEVLERDPPEDRALGRYGINRDDVVTAPVERERELTGATADVEDAGRRVGELRQDEICELDAAQRTDRAGAARSASSFVRLFGRERLVRRGERVAVTAVVTEERSQPLEDRSESATAADAGHERSFLARKR